VKRRERGVPNNGNSFLTVKLFVMRSIWGFYVSESVRAFAVESAPTTPSQAASKTRSSVLFFGRRMSLIFCFFKKLKIPWKGKKNKVSYD